MKPPFSSTLLLMAEALVRAVSVKSDVYTIPVLI